jgi:hypothetical protein
MIIILYLLYVAMSHSFMSDKDVYVCITYLALNFIHSTLTTVDGIVINQVVSGRQIAVE